MATERAKRWTLDTMEMINTLTPTVKGKAFDPDWFLLRQRLEQIESELAEQGEMVRRLRQVCGEAYQLAGAYGASAEALDNLSDAANGKPLRHTTFLPVTVVTHCCPVTSPKTTEDSGSSQAEMVRRLREALADCMPLMEFYLEREIGSPSNHQEFAREKRELRDRLRALLAECDALPATAPPAAKETP